MECRKVMVWRKIKTGMKVEGVVTDINNGEVAVDIGTKHTGYIPASELTDDPTKKPEDIVKVGDKIDLIVLKTNDQEGIVTLSKKKVDAVLGFQKIVEAKEADATLTGTVTNVVKGGVLVSANGVKVFIPASQAAPRRDFDLNDLLKQSVSFKILEVNEAKQRAVGSIRAVAREERAAAQAKFFETAQIGSEVEGTVKSITDYGVFVDLGGVDGLIRRMDLSWNRIKHPSDVVSVGDKITVTIKDIDSETKKVSLTYKKASENPWEIFKANYEFGGTSGLVTMEDIIEEIVGEIHDEYDDEERTYVVLNDHTWIFEAKTQLTDFYKIAKVDEDEFERVVGDADTLAGMLLEIKGEFPALHEKVTYHNYEFEVLEMDSRRILKVKFTILPKEETEGAEDKE